MYALEDSLGEDLYEIARFVTAHLAVYSLLMKPLHISIKKELRSMHTIFSPILVSMADEI